MLNDMSHLTVSGTQIAEGGVALIDASKKQRKMD